MITDQRRRAHEVKALRGDDVAVRPVGDLHTADRPWGVVGRHANSLASPPMAYSSTSAEIVVHAELQAGISLLF